MFGALINRLLADVAFAIPLVVTYWVLSFGYGLVISLSRPWLRPAGINIPRLGFVITLSVSMPPRRILPWAHQAHKAAPGRTRTTP
ncbi:MAG: hypothetical protein WCI38_03345 [Chthoniobacterales bacterium]